MLFSTVVCADDFDYEAVKAELKKSDQYFNYGLDKIEDKPVEKKMARSRESKPEMNSEFVDLEQKYFESDSVNSALSGMKKEGSKKLRRARE